MYIRCCDTNLSTNGPLRHNQKNPIYFLLFDSSSPWSLEAQSAFTNSKHPRDELSSSKQMS